MLNVHTHQAIKLLQKQPTRCNGRQLRMQLRKTAGDEIRIDEVQDAGAPWQELAGESGLSRTIRTGNHHTARRSSLAFALAFGRQLWLSKAGSALFMIIGILLSHGINR